ncbi:MAG: hypothetical protein JSV96_04785 [Candidatus Aminicenantes bacterium]|nr:MAG: hypothetical protein JSV96_04785 [Candidatus Aminicenantes bacterium]
MFIVAQFPIADARPFIDSETYKLSIPSWPFARPYEEFVRYSGPIERRKKGGIKDWSGEELYSRASRAIRFPGLRTRRLGGKDAHLSPHCTFRRFFSNGEAVARVEVAFRTRRGWYRFDENSFLSVIESCLALPTVISSPISKNPQCDLQMAGRYLADLYLYASTQTAYQKDPDLQDWWIKDGKPLLWIEYKDYEVKNIPKVACPVKSLIKFNIHLSHCWIDRRKGKSSRVWLLKFSSNSDFDIIRRLRLNLLRLHAEQECLREILRLIGQHKIFIKRGTDASDRLQQYLNSATKIISGRGKYGLPQSELLEAALDYEDIVSEGERVTLLSQLEEIRKNILLKIEKYTAHEEKPPQQIIIVKNPTSDVNFVTGTINKIGTQTMTKIKVTLGDGTVFHGDFVVAKNIEDSFNKAQQFQVDENLKKKLEELSSLVAKLCEQLPDDKANEVSRDLQSIVNEATSEKPRKEWYELSAKGLIEAAKTVASMAGPIVTTVKTILSLLV